MNAIIPWLAFITSTLILVVYEAWTLWLGVRKPERVARSANARMRADWVGALSRQPGFEIVAVQALRNSLMSATIAASTAALALMGSISLASTNIGQLAAMETPTPRAALEILLMATLFASYVCSAMSMRYYSHASMVMSMPVSSPERQSLHSMAVEYVQRAGLLYSWALRFFLMVAPVVVGIVRAPAMPAMTVALIVALWFFDRPARATEAAEALKAVGKPGA